MSKSWPNDLTSFNVYFSFFFCFFERIDAIVEVFLWFVAETVEEEEGFSREVQQNLTM